MRSFLQLLLELVYQQLLMLRSIEAKVFFHICVRKCKKV